MCLSLQRRVVLWARTGAVWDKGYQGRADSSIVKAWCIQGGWKGICPHLALPLLQRKVDLVFIRGRLVCLVGRWRQQAEMKMTLEFA